MTRPRSLLAAFVASSYSIHIAEFDKEIIKYGNLLNCACFNKASNYKFREFFERIIVIISLFFLMLFAYFVVSNATFQFNTYLLGARETVCFVIPRRSKDHKT